MFIEVTSAKTGNTVRFNAMLICAILPIENGTEIGMISGLNYNVKEPAEKVMELINATLD